MLSPTAAAPLAVLVLAWDETTPAVRALVEAHAEAAPAFDSVVVVVPAGSPEATEPTQEEFLPLAAGPELLAASTPTTAEATTETPAEEPTPAAPTTPLLLSESAPILADELSVATTLPATLVPDAEQLTLVPASTWAEVRIIRLSSFSLPALADLTSQALPAPAWLLTAISPATPYVGRSEESALVEVPVVTPVVETASLEEVETAPFAEATTAPPTPVSAVEPLAAEPASSSALPSPVAITLAAGENDNLDAEADTAPMLVADEDAAATLLPAPAPPFVPEQASWPEALAALREPVGVVADPAARAHPSGSSRRSRRSNTASSVTPTESSSSSASS